jgi:hypothetical protein
MGSRGFEEKNCLQKRSGEPQVYDQMRGSGVGVGWGGVQQGKVVGCESLA